MAIKTDEIIPNTENTLSVENGELDSTNYRAIFSLRRITEMVRERGGVAHVLLIPQNFVVGDVAKPHISYALRDRATDIRQHAGLRQSLMRVCAAEKLSCYDLAPLLAPSDYLPDDAHWNASGHAKVGAFFGPDS